MANKKISELTAASALTGDEIVPVVQSGVTKRTTVDDLKDFATSGLGPEPTSLSDSISRITPNFGRTVCGFSVSQAVSTYGGFQDGGSLATSYDFASPTGLTELLRQGRRSSSAFSTGAGGTGATTSPYYQTIGYDQYRRMSGHSY